MNYPIRNAKQRIYSDRMRAWIKAKDANACILFVAEMAQSKNADALPALMELLRVPNSLWKRRREAEMCEVREAAVRAIAHIDAPDALSCIGIALFSPCTGVRAVASQLLHQAGSSVAEPLARMLTWRHNWSVEGMCILLYLLGNSKNPNAGQPLMRVVRGGLPIVPPRRKFEVCFELLPLVIFEAVLLLSMAAMNAFSLSEGLGTLGICIAVNAFIFSTSRTQIKDKEWHSLMVAACEGLQMLGDTKAIPTLLDASQREEKDVAGAAKIALYALLPALCANDTDWLPMEARHQLATLLHQREPELVLPVLRAMEFIGADVAVRRIASMITHGATPTIRAEALRIYPILLERQRLEKISGTLLRASQCPPPVQGELLRPIASTANSDNAPQEMLRASNEQGK